MASDNSGLKLPIWIYKTPLPKTQRLQFENTFKNLDKKTEELFKNYTIVREEVRGALEIDSTSAIISTIERYMPAFFGLMEAAEALPPDFSKFLKISWTCPIGFKYNTTVFTTNTFRYEVVMAMLAYAIAHRNAAHDLLKNANVQDSDFEEQSKTIAQLLTKSAGVFDHIYCQQLSNWKVRPENVQLPELCDELYLAMSTLCIAEAQEITIKKGLMKGTSVAAISKLCVDVFQKYEYINNLLRNMKGCPASEVLPPLLNYVSINMKVWKAVSYKLVAMDCYSKGEYGVAVGNLKMASSIATEEKKDPLLESFLSGYNNERTVIQELLKKYSSENDTIYYDKVPSDIPLPEGKCLMKVTPFTPPPLIKIEINQKHQQSCLLQ